MKKMEPKVSVIILNYNNIYDTLECIESVSNSNYSNYEIILVDNGSKKEIYTELISKLQDNKKITILRSNLNGGFGFGNNIGIRYGYKRGTEYFLILNNDTIINTNTIKSLVTEMEKSDEIGIVFPIILLQNNQNERIVNSIGGEFCVFGFANDRGFGKRYEQIRNKINNRFFYAPGTCFLISRKLIKQSGIFDENIFLYWEDVDLSWRARLSNYKIRIVTNDFIIHKLNISTGKRKNPLKLYHREFSSLYVMFKNLSLVSLFLFMPICLLQKVVKILFALSNEEYLKAMIKAYKKFFLNMDKWVIARKKIQLSRKISDCKLAKYNSFNPIYRSIRSKNKG